MKFIAAFILSIFILGGQPASAQQNGSLAGQVVDSLGAVVPNANVTVTNGNGVEKTGVSTNNGQFTITGIPAGVYTVRAVATDFAPYENTEVNIAAGTREELIITLTVAEVQAEVEITTDNQVTTDPENNQSALTLKGSDLEALPEDPDELAAALQALAGPAAGPNGGQFYIDGFSGGRLPPRETIREIRVNQNPFSSEFDRPGFGRVEIFTKPGADKFRGQAFFNFNDESLNSRNPFAANRASSQTRFFGGNISGPLIKNKASFFLDIDRREFDDNAIINATILDQNFNQVLFTQALVVPTRRFSISPRFDYAINERNTLIGRYSFQQSTTDNRGIGEFSLPTRAFNTENTEHNLQLTETAILSATAINETRFQYFRSRNNQEGDNSIPALNVSGSFNAGGSNIGLNFNNEDRFELQNYTTLGLNTHSLKFGARLRYVSINDRSESNFAGTFTFAGIPLRFDANGNQIDVNGNLIANPIRLVNGQLPTQSVSSLEQYRQLLLGNTDARFRPSQFTITGGDPLANIKQTDFSVFLNDDWRVSPQLTLSYGVRYEAQTNVSNNFNLAPRFGFAYSPGAGGARAPKTVLRGGFGIFYDRISENLSLQENRFNGQNQVQYFVTNPTLLSQPIFTLNGVSNVPTAAQVAALVPGSSVVRQLAEDIRSPYTMQTALSVERQLPFRTTLSFTYLFTRTNDLLRQRNINAPLCPPGAACPLGNTAALNALRPNPTLGNIYQYESTGRFNQNQLIVNFNTRLNPNFSIFGNYRLNRAQSDVDGGGGFAGFGGGGFGGASAGNFPFYSYDLTGEYGDSFQDVRHSLFIGGNFGLPFGIRASPFIIARSASPFNIITGVDSNGDSLFTERPSFAQLSARCNVLELSNSFCNISDVADPNAIIPRNYGRGANFFNVNLNLNKTFGFGNSRNRAAANAPNQSDNAGGRGGNAGGIPGVGGGGPRGGGGGGRGGRGGGGFGQGGAGSDSPYNLTLGVQISNLLNRTNLGSPISNISSPRFGDFNSIARFGFGGGGSNAGNRQVVLQLRFSF